MDKMSQLGGKLFKHYQHKFSYQNLKANILFANKGANTTTLLSNASKILHKDKSRNGQTSPKWLYPYINSNYKLKLNNFKSNHHQLHSKVKNWTILNLVTTALKLKLTNQQLLSVQIPEIKTQNVQKKKNE